MILTRKRMLTKRTMMAGLIYIQSVELETIHGQLARNDSRSSFCCQRTGANKQTNNHMEIGYANQSRYLTLLIYN